MRLAGGVRVMGALLLGALLAAGCSHRDRANPLDPANPITQGRPTGFNALAGFANVRLTWDARPTAGLDGFQLQRRDHPDSAFRVVANLLAPGSTQYLDGSVSNGVRYTYRLYYVRDGAAGGAPSEDAATPGGVRPFVVDAGFDGPAFVALLTTDGRDVLQRYSDWDSPTSLAVDGQTGLVWVSEPFAGNLALLSSVSGSVQRVPVPGQPFTLALDPLNGNAWMCDLDGAVRHYSPAGAPVTPAVIPLLDSPSGVAVSRVDRTFWVCERNGDRVRRYDVAGVPIVTAFVVAPSRVAVDSVSQQAVITSLARGRVVRVAANGARVDSTSAAVGPLGVDVDALRGTIWVADAVGGQLLGLRTSDLSVAVRVTGMSGVRDVTVDPATGEVWAVVNGLRSVWRLSASGTLLDRLDGFDNPQEVRLDTGRR